MTVNHATPGRFVEEKLMYMINEGKGILLHLADLFRKN
jgi:hypothetical protein